MTLLAQNEAKMQQLMNAVQEFEAWGGIQVNTTKTKLMTIDGITVNRTEPVTVTHRDEPLTITPESESVRYLVFWATPNDNMRATMDLVFDRTIKAKETIQGQPLDPKQAIEVFAAKAVGNFRYLATAPWKRKDLDSLDRLWRQGYKTAWKLNESTANHPWTSPKDMGGMGYTTTLSVIAHTLNAHVDRCMQTEDVACQIMKNNLQRAMQEWICTSKAEMTREAEARSWDETTVNVWHRLDACDHLLDTDSWKHGEPPQGQGISFVTATRHLRILKRRIEEIMGTSVRHQDTHRIWRNISKEQWELMWSGETALHRYGTALWASGHRTVNLLPDTVTVQTPHIMCITGAVAPRHTAKVPVTKGLPPQA